MIDWILSYSFLILMVIGTRAIFKDRISQRLRYALWALVLLRLLIPVNMLRHGGDVLLDDLRVTDVERELGVPVTVVEQDGFDLLDAVLGRK